MHNIKYDISIVMCSCVAAGMHRRHLMVWAIFALKVAFEAVIWGVLGVVSLLYCIHFLYQNSLLFHFKNCWKETCMSPPGNNCDKFVFCTGL